MIINCRSIKNKVDEFMGLIETVRPTIVLATESWLDDTIGSNEVFPDNYAVYRKDRNSHGGGVFVLVEKGVPTTPLPIPDVTIETAWCQMCLDGKHLSVGVYYRPPHENSNGLDELADLILASSKEYILLGGDFNIPDLIWEDGKATYSGSTLHTKLSAIVEMFDLTQYVMEGTRLLNVLDLLLCNLPGAIDNVCVLPGISDHKIVTADLVHSKINKYKCQARKIFYYDKGRYDTIRSELVSFFSYFLEQSDNVSIDALWNIFKCKIHDLVEKYIPSGVKSSKTKNKPWVTKEVKQIIK